MLFELIRDMILCHKRVFDIWLQTAISSVPVIDKAKKELFLRGVKYCLDLEPEEKREFCLQKLGTPFCLHDPFETVLLGLSLVDTLMRVLLGCFLYNFFIPRTIGK